jgi:hypothetical protein
MVSCDTFDELGNAIKIDDNFVINVEDGNFEDE